MACVDRNYPLTWRVDFVRRQFREERRQRAEEPSESLCHGGIFNAAGTNWIGSWQICRISTPESCVIQDPIVYHLCHRC